ncbi:unnamed protein product [Boreogadus saida]
MPLVVANGGVLSRFGLGESIDPTEPLNLSAELVTLTPVELAFEEPSTSQSPVLEEMWNPPAPPPPLQDVYPELREKLETRSEIARIENIAPDTLSFLVTFLEPFYNAQRELEGDKYATINLVCLWFEKLKRHCQPSPTYSPQQAFFAPEICRVFSAKIQVNMTHKVALFLWPTFNKLRIMSPVDISELHAHVRTLILSVEEDAAAAILALNDQQQGPGETQTLQSWRTRMITNLK